jgi:hypothetical protein
MKAIRNTTPAPLRVPLRSGKFLHLGPGQSGHIADEALRAPAVARLVESGVLEVAGEEGRPPEFSEAGRLPREFAHGHTHATKVFPSGNRGG